MDVKETHAHPVDRSPPVGKEPDDACRSHTDTESNHSRTLVT